MVSPRSGGEACFKEKSHGEGPRPAANRREKKKGERGNRGENVKRRWRNDESQVRQKEEGPSIPTYSRVKEDRPLRNQTRFCREKEKENHRKVWESVLRSEGGRDTVPKAEQAEG